MVVETVCNAVVEVIVVALPEGNRSVVVVEVSLPPVGNILVGSNVFVELIRARDSVLIAEEVWISVKKKLLVELTGAGDTVLLIEVLRIFVASKVLVEFMGARGTMLTAGVV